MRNTLIWIVAASVACLFVGNGCSKKAAERPAEVVPQAAAPSGEAPAMPESDDNEGLDDVIVKDTVISKFVSPKGLTLVLEGGVIEGAEVVEAHGAVDGEYAIISMINGVMMYSVERLTRVASGEKAVTDAVSMLEADGEIRDLTAAPTTACKNLSYPVYNVTYTKGNNEDTKQCSDYYIQTDGFDFRFHTCIPADYVDEYAPRVKDMAVKLMLQENKGEG